MKALILIIALLIAPIIASAQKHTPLPHGTIFGNKPNVIAMMKASQLEAYMDTRTRISTTIEGKVIAVATIKGGWFTMDAGGGKTIAAHFKNYGINLPADLKGHNVIIEGVAQKQFIADDGQHFAGDTVNGKKQHLAKANPSRRLSFEVTGMMVD